MVNLKKMDAPTPCRWYQNFTVEFEGVNYTIQLLSDDEGVEDTNVNFWIEGDEEEIDRDEVPVEVLDFVVELTFDPTTGQHIQYL